MTQAFGVPTSDNPRPYGCPECDTAFRKHGHLAKHLRSKSHITKLEANGLIPTGTFAVLDKCGPELKEKLVTTNCELSLISLRKIAMQLFADRPELAAMASPERHMMLSPGSTRFVRMGSNNSPPSLVAGTSVDLSGSCHTSVGIDESSGGAQMGGMMPQHYAAQPLDYGNSLGSVGMAQAQQQPISMIDSHTGGMSSSLPPPLTSSNSRRNLYEPDFTGSLGNGGASVGGGYVTSSTRPSIIHGSHSPSNTSHMIVQSPGVLCSPAPPPPLEITQQVATSASGNFLPTHHPQQQQRQQQQPPLPPHNQQQFHQNHSIQQRSAPPASPLQQQHTHFINATSAQMPISSSPAAYHSSSNNNLQYLHTGGSFKMPPVTTQHFSHGNQAAAMQQPDIL